VEKMGDKEKTCEMEENVYKRTYRKERVKGEGKKRVKGKGKERTCKGKENYV
jgi:hypothetical protein